MNELVKKEDTEVTQGTATGSIQAIAQLAGKDGMTPEILQQYIEANKDMIRFQGEMDFNADRAKMAAKLPPIEEKHYNSQTRSHYAKLEDILDAIGPVLEEFGFSVGFSNRYPDHETIEVTAKLFHKGGHFDQNTVLLPLDKTGAKGTVNKTNVHAAGSSQTYGQRYAINGLLPLRYFNKDNKLSSFDDDGVIGGTALITEDQRDEILSLLGEAGIDVAQFCNGYLKMESVSMIPAQSFGKVKNAILKRMESNG